uniref:Uncharacterized protein LOC116937639 n=1 Tax=Petromyzon marinus TaxID=7757 RepID=A0AAJ7WK92_PETMA|nr:uncharacterized protein LOC116937639 [Petromyzon marinus]
MMMMIISSSSNNSHVANTSSSSIVTIISCNNSSSRLLTNVVSRRSSTTNNITTTTITKTINSNNSTIINGIIITDTVPICCLCCLIINNSITIFTIGSTGLGGMECRAHGRRGDDKRRGSGRGLSPQAAAPGFPLMRCPPILQPASSVSPDRLFYGPMSREATSVWRPRLREVPWPRGRPKVLLTPAPWEEVTRWSAGPVQESRSAPSPPFAVTQSGWRVTGNNATAKWQRGVLRGYPGHPRCFPRCSTACDVIPPP